VAPSSLLPRILVATVPEATLRIQRALPDEALCIVRTIAEATRELRREAFRLAIFGLYFDESRMFELVSVARAAALNRGTPILCVHGNRRRVTSAALRGIEESVKTIGCTWLDLAAIADDEAGRASLREELQNHLAAVPPSAAESPPLNGPLR
jgi:hypothetical protein